MNLQELKDQLKANRDNPIEIRKLVEEYLVDAKVETDYELFKDYLIAYYDNFEDSVKNIIKNIISDGKFDTKIDIELLKAAGNLEDFELFQKLFEKRDEKVALIELFTDFIENKIDCYNIVEKKELVLEGFRKSIEDNLNFHGMNESEQARRVVFAIDNCEESFIKSQIDAFISYAIRQDNPSIIESWIKKKPEYDMNRLLRRTLSQDKKEIVKSLLKRSDLKIDRESFQFIIRIEDSEYKKELFNIIGKQKLSDLNYNMQDEQDEIVAPTAQQAEAITPPASQSPAHSSEATTPQASQSPAHSSESITPPASKSSAHSSPEATTPQASQSSAHSSPEVTTPPASQSPAQSSPKATTSPASKSSAQSSPATTSQDSQSSAHSSPEVTTSQDNQSPAHSSESITPPASQSSAHSSPEVTTSQDNQSPAHSSESITPPASQSPAQSSPKATTSPASKSSAQSSPATTSPASKSSAQSSPATTSQDSQSSAHSSEVITPPAGQSPAQSSPASKIKQINSKVKEVLTNSNILSATALTGILYTPLTKGMYDICDGVAKSFAPVTKHIEKALYIPEITATQKALNIFTNMFKRAVPLMVIAACFVGTCVFAKNMYKGKELGESAKAAGIEMGKIGAESAAGTVAGGAVTAIAAGVGATGFMLAALPVAASFAAMYLAGKEFDSAISK